MANRQQKQAAKAVRRRQAVAVKQQAERQASSLAGRVAAAAAGPVERCLRSANMAEAGIAHVILARRLESGALGCGFFLVDLLCLGVKEAFYREVAPSDLDDRVAEMAADAQPMVAVDPASAKKLILGAVAFAAGCGMDPAKDYRTVVRLFDGVDAGTSAESFAFGRDGTAVYIPGSKDSMSRMRDVGRRLRRALGEDGWDSDVPGRDRAVLRNIVEALDRERGTRDGGLSIEHESETEPRHG